MTPYPPQPRRTRTRRRPSALGPRHSTRALTLVEVLLSVALLCLAIGVVMTAVSSIAGMESNGRKRLAAYEVANRIMLSYLDDAKKMPDKHLPIEYGERKFYWDLDETPAVMKVNQKQEAGANLQALDRWKLIVVTVYDQDTDGGMDMKGEPLALLSRAIDPYNQRNPDSMETFSADPTRITDMIRGLVGGATTGGGSTRTTGRQLR
jgi:hypothetical protein